MGRSTTVADSVRARRLIFIHPSDERYGADRMLVQMLEALSAAARTRVEVWLPTDLPHAAYPLCHELEQLGFKVRHIDTPILRRAYRSPVGAFRLLVRAVALLRRLRSVRPAMVYCTSSAALLAAPVARTARVPYVVAHAQEIWSGGDRRVLSVLARSCHRLVAISQPVADALPASVRRRTVTVENASPDPGDPRPITDHGPLRFVIASRWNRWKGHGTLLAAWERAGSPGTLHVLGGPPPSGDVTDVRAVVARMKRADSIRIIGEVADASEYLNEADVAVVPSDEPEPFGLVAIEAFARGRPVIASSAGGLADIVTNDRNGWLFPPQDVDALATILRGLTRPMVVAAGRDGRRTFEERYTVTRFRREWLQAVAFDSFHILGSASGEP